MAPEKHATASVTVYEAAKGLKRAPSTLHVWAVRYNARKVGKRGRKTLYDYNDLVIIERELFHHHPVPNTWQERAAIRDRCPMKTADSEAA